MDDRQLLREYTEVPPGDYQIEVRLAAERVEGAVAVPAEISADAVVDLGEIPLTTPAGRRSPAD